MIDLLIAAGHHIKLGVIATAAAWGAVVAAAETTGTDPVLLVTLAVIGGLPATIAAIGAIVIGLRNSAKVEAVATAVDGVSSKLVAATERAASAEGHAAGVAQERAAPQSPVEAVAVTAPDAGSGSDRIVAAIEAASAKPIEITQPVEVIQDPSTPPIRVKTDKAPKP